MKPVPTCLLLAVVLAGAATAQSGGIRYYGQACTNPATPPFQVLGTPAIGRTLLVETLSGARLSDAMSVPSILVGASDRMAFGVPLPFDIGPFSRGLDVYCGFLLQSSEAELAIPSFRGAPQLVQVPIRIPADPGLVGATFYMQVLGRAMTSLVRTSTTTLTRGAAVTIGR